ncbi:hypothetical protein A2960_01155 [Candidatus Gottesmanbacteria bacterium RIFCSPLOWO2_01_FULL_39_12b]|uniref:DegT/DnrJ/EryC1/StrS aminotransferase n=1 Tax=Candidatus Gottesmanbacteria bacterium RIFCSPLOWO2_01_FULL_39_12b TaxID=1798388 RepID=A0A1F6AQJ8_9BACT|nr:MAG: hypothetical protein A2960_01155 [Candidatus Gottesmanbacteria bacterium RIFCSPLOWO2_01_FULL_39_12b]
MFNYPIAISLSPNTDDDDIRQAVKILFQPWCWKKGREIDRVEKWFCDYFGVPEAVSFNSGISALFALLKAFEIGKDDEVLIQAFTCVAVVEPILWTGGRPVFVDIDEGFNLDYRLIEQKITRKTRAIIVQNTFGTPANIDKITKIVQKHNLILIEDCAHSLGGEFKGGKLGSFGDAAFFSFGRDKVISSVFGGMAIINLKFNPPAGGQNQKLREIQKNLEYPSYFWILQQLLHPIAFACILPLYNLILGKIILFLLMKARILSKPVYKEELIGEKPKTFPFKYPNALASLLIRQLDKLKNYNDKRNQIADYYYKYLEKKKSIILPPYVNGSIFLRFNILINNANKVFAKAKKNKVVLGNWYHNVIDPEGVELEKIGYIPGRCPKAESYAKRSVNLPTYPRLNEDNINQVVKLINKYATD